MPKVGESKADPKNCHDFLQCTERGWEKLHCSADLVFNEDISVCEWPKPGTKFGYHGGSELDPCDKVGEYKADPDHCDLYYKCTSCGWTILTCGPGLLFHPNTLSCESAGKFNCEGGDHPTQPPLGLCGEISKLVPDPKN